MSESGTSPLAAQVLHRIHAHDELKHRHGLTHPKHSAPSAKRLFKANQPVFHQGQLATHLYEVTSGFLMLSKMTEDGRRHIVEIVPPGWICGFSAAGAYDASCEALADTTVISYKKSDIEKFSSGTEQNRFLRQAERQICALHDHGLMLSRKSAQERVAAFLMRFVPGRGVPNCAGPALSDDSAVVDVPMSGREIGDFLGLNAETVSRAITALERDQVVARAHGKRNSFRIIDVCGLCKSAHNDCGLASMN